MNNGNEENNEMNIMLSDSKGFYIGDPCYVLNKDVYQNEWGDKEDFRDGVIQTSQGIFAVHRTRYGDGEYPARGSCDAILAVDSGTLALVPISMVDPEVTGGRDLRYYGTSVPYKFMSMYVDDDCEFVFTSEDKNTRWEITVPTGYDEDDEDYGWEEEEEGE